MNPECTVRVRWSDRQAALGLPTSTRILDPAWVGGRSAAAEGWTLAITFDPPPAVQGNPSIGRAQFAVPGAPHEVLRPGALLELFERATGHVAVLEVLG